MSPFSGMDGCQGPAGLDPALGLRADESDTAPGERGRPGRMEPDGWALAIGSTWDNP